MVDATYSGGWIAHVQAFDPDGNGDITLGTMAMHPYDGELRDEATVGVDLEGLANLRRDH